MEILVAGDRPSKKANPDWFSGTVWQDQIIDAPEPARVRGIRVTFLPGSRTNWHTHPLGQTLYVLEGTGLVGGRNREVHIIKPGDTIWIPPLEEHWHGATATNVMVHLAIQESLNGKTATWLEKVSDNDYEL